MIKYILLMCIWCFIALYEYYHYYINFLVLYSDNYLNWRLQDDDTERFYTWQLVSWRKEQHLLKIF